MRTHFVGSFTIAIPPVDISESISDEEVVVGSSTHGEVQLGRPSAVGARHSNSKLPHEREHRKN